jgi:hypothetical protein
MHYNDNYLWTLILALTLALGACSKGENVPHEQFSFLDELGITLNEKLLLGDTLTLPDVYCGDPDQQASDPGGIPLDDDQYQALIVPAGHGIPDAMSNWLLLGVRDMGNGITLAAFYAGNGVGYCVDLITYDKQGKLLDAINARELHLVWRCDMSNFEDDNSFTLDGMITFEGSDCMVLHRTMGKCIMDFNNDLKATPQWQQQWDQTYVINAKGLFVLQGQQVVKEQGKVDQYAALDFKSWDMLVCSLYDEGIMDTWNEYSLLVNSTYDPDYQYNPFPWDVAQLYKMNPQRFLRWMAAKRESGNLLLPQFKLAPDDRPALLQEIARLDDPSAQQWLTNLVNSWDDKPLTKHQ